MDELRIGRWRMVAEGPQWRRTLVAERGGEPAGTVALTAPRWHSERLWLDLEVEPHERRRGVGSALLREARALSLADGRPLRAKVPAGSAGARFAEIHGFHILQRCRTFFVPRPMGDAPDRVGLVVEAHPSLDRVAEAFRDFYTRGHVWDPAGDMSAADVRGTHVDEATAVLLVQDSQGNAHAVGCLYVESEGLLLSGGPTVPGDPAARPATGALLDAALAIAGRDGVALCVEADDYPPEVVEDLELRGAEVLDEMHIVTDR